MASLELTARETEVRRLTEKGRSPRQIAHLLDISYKTAESHIYNFRRKLKEQARRKALTASC
jgi:DNA-binding CsgD family transcriptional regulator